MGRNHNNHSTDRRRLAVALLAVGALALPACGGDDGDDAASAAREETGGVVDDAAGGESIAVDAGDADADAEPAATGDAGGFDLGSVGRDVIVEMHVVVSTDDIQRTVASITAAASSLGGGVAASDVDFGSRTAEGRVDGRAVIVVKVPPTAIDAMLGRLDDTGSVVSIDQSAQDVTDQLVDLDVRIRNQRASVEHVRDFMERTDDLTELVALERELSQRQTELERLEAQQRNLSDRVSLSTITIEVVPTAAVPAPEPDEGIGDALRTGWDAFAGFFFGLAFVLAVLAPFLLLGTAIGLVAWALARRLRRPATPLAPPHAEAPVTDERVDATRVG